MDEKEIFRKLTVGTRFDLKRFQADAEKLKVTTVNVNVYATGPHVDEYDCDIASEETRNSLTYSLLLCVALKMRPLPSKQRLGV